MRSIFCLFFTTFCLQSGATTFVETPIEERLHSSSGVIEAQFVSSSSKRLPSGEIVTEASFSIQGMSGIKPSDIVNSHSFKVLLPGGSWQGRHYKVHGVPEFAKNEISYLILREGKFGYTLANLAMSKLKRIERDGVPYLQSSIFPNKEGVGLILEADFQSHLLETFGERLVSLNLDKFVDKGKGLATHLNQTNHLDRSPASARLKGNRNRGVSSENKETNDLSVLWLILALGGLGFISTLLSKGRKNEGKSP